ncbi:beta strand repeat-containing protein [Rhizorhapis sp. SPR117]|uniref:beta strand repeat-containing protein n=1 Tax=Rhizorhapis sp. SPR117 TaxID=2912611 RepID=UPI001F3B8B55|nr:S-layer family protein [Rhizorhapis sp. SPR117]
MSNKSRRMRSALLAGAGTALITGLAASPVAAAPSEDQTSTNSITVQQQFNDFNTPTAGQELNGNTQGSINADITNNDEDNFALENSTVTVGSSPTTGNSSSATGYANTADLTVNADLNNVAGSGFATENASSNGATTGATVNATTDIGVALTQQNVSTAATVSNGTDLGVTIDNGATDSTVTIAGNRNAATGVLNSGSTLIDASANNSSGSSGIGSSQSSVDSTLAVSVSSLNKLETGSGTSGVALNDSTAELTDNSQTATAVANSGSNQQSVAGNDLTLADEATGNAQVGGAASAMGGYATASNQELSGATAAGVSSTISDAAGVGGYLATIDGDVVGSTLNNDRNAANALARGNEVVNATSIDANSIATGSLAAPASGTVAAIASQQSVTGTVAIDAAVTGAGTDGPMVSNVITGDLGANSAITASDNSVLANAVGNRGGNAISASATTIDTSGSEIGTAFDGNANAAFAVASQQTVSEGTTITAGLVDDVAAPAAGTSISTDIDGSVIDSSVASLGNTLTASVAGNQSLTGGNAVTLSGTNIATNAAVANVQSMDGDLAAAIGSEGTAAVPAGSVPFTFAGSSTGADGNYTFTGTAAGSAGDRDALAAAYPTLSFTYDTGVITIVADNQLSDISTFDAAYATLGSAGSPASGGVIVTVGNDITNSSVAVNGNATDGSVMGNSGTNRIVADATDLSGGSAMTAASSTVGGGTVQAIADLAVANTQSVGETAELTSNVGGVFGITAEGVTAPDDLSDVSDSTLSVSENTLDSAVTGNAVANSVGLSATNLSNTSALASSQQMDGVLSAQVADFTGAFAVIGRDVTSSSVLVDGNAISGATTGNDAANTLAVAGSSTLAAGDTTVGATADPSAGILDSDRVAAADHALTNVQGLGAGTLVTNVTAGYGISTLGAGAPGLDDDTSDIASSTLSVSDNVQSAMTTGNTAANVVGISGGSIATNGALLSVQTSGADSATATSTMSVAAPAANELSTLALNGNANSASSTVNAAENSMTVAAATNLASTTVDAGPPATEGANASLSGDATSDYVAAADYVVNNFQAVDAGTVAATATTDILNNDGGTDPAQFVTDGIQQSTVTVNGNATQANATSNRSVNSLALSANSTSASAGVLNQQESAAGVTATATTTAGVEVSGYEGGVTDPSPIDSSALTVAGNATTARAGGNTSTNSLSAAATAFANNSAGGSTSLDADRADSVSATFAVLNEQANSGPINAAANVTYGAGFNTLGDAPTVTNSAVALNGNSAASVAYGNAATNQLTFAALNSPVAGVVPTTTAIASNQLNTGNVTAATGALAGSLNINANSTGAGNNGPVSQSSLSINGNALSAAAYGNSATNTLTVGGNNVNVTVSHLIP